MSPAPIRTAVELYVHAIAIEKEAAERYAEFALRMADEGSDEVAALFRQLSRAELDHLDALLRRTEGCCLPPVPLGDYRWIESGAPDPGVGEVVNRLMTPHQALAIALTAEKRARDFFESVRHTAEDPAVRALAQEMAMEESGHVSQVLRMMELTKETSHG